MRHGSDELTALATTLIAEFAGRVPAPTVRRQVAQAREQLMAAGVRAGLIVAAEEMVRVRLRALTPAHAMQ